MTDPWKTIERSPLPEEHYSIALTGHRPGALAGYDLSAPFYQLLEDRLYRIGRKALERYDQLVLRSGMALGADTVWSQTIIRLKEEFPERVYFVAEVPVRSQPDRWIGEKDKLRWREHLGKSDQIRIYGESYGVKYLHARNQGMIEKANLLIAVWDGSEQGGTAGAVKYATKIGRRIHRIDPATLKAMLEA